MPIGNCFRHYQRSVKYLVDKEHLVSFTTMVSYSMWDINKILKRNKFNQFSLASTKFLPKLKNWTKYIQTDIKVTIKAQLYVGWSLPEQTPIELRYILEKLKL